jgi:serine/threonine-protein kinase
VIAGPDRGKQFTLPLNGPVRFGRAPDVEARLNDPRVSRYQFRVDVSEGQVRILDLGSKAGTAVNNQRISSEQRLLTGDLIVVGETQLQLISAGATDTTDNLPAVPQELAPAPAASPAAARRSPGAPPAAAAPVSTGRSPSSVQDLTRLANTTLGYFTLGPVLAVGQHGVVFRAMDTRDRSPVALKVFGPDFSRRKEDVQRFTRAAKTIMPLRHLNLIDFYNAGRLHGYCWASMELIEGPSVAWHVQQAALGQVDWRLGAAVLRDVTRALIFLHGKGVLHRNLTPENLMVSAANGLVKVGDLLTAKAQEGKLATDITCEGDLIGDLRFLAPERSSGEPSEGDERSDLYSLGAVVYAVLTGRPPLEGKSVAETIDKIRRTTPTPPRVVQPTVHGALDALVMRLLAKEPGRRFNDAKELLRHLVEQNLMG